MKPIWCFVIWMIIANMATWLWSYDAVKVIVAIFIAILLVISVICFCILLDTEVQKDRNERIENYGK